MYFSVSLFPLKLPQNRIYTAPAAQRLTMIIDPTEDPLQNYNQYAIITNLCCAKFEPDWLELLIYVFYSL